MASAEVDFARAWLRLKVERLLAETDMTMDAFAGAIMGLAGISPEQGIAIHRRWVLADNAKTLELLKEEVMRPEAQEALEAQLVAAGWTPPPTGGSTP